jgi:hypothetical protein
MAMIARGTSRFSREAISMSALTLAGILLNALLSQITAINRQIDSCDKRRRVRRKI